LIDIAGNNRRRARALSAWAAVTLAAACAVQEAPSGGPEDRNPPKVAATIPAPDSVGVDPASDIAIAFSEDMTRARVERLVSTEPPIVLGSIRWRDRTLLIHVEGGLQRDTTYVVRVKSGYRDRHGVPGVDEYQFAFATGAALDSARVEGAVFFKKEPSAKALVRAFRVPRDTAFTPEAARPDRETPTEHDGRYALRYLPSRGARFVVMAFVDVNGNGAFERATEPFAVVPDTVVLDAAHPVVSGLAITIIDPNEPARVHGVVVNESGIDSVRATVCFYASEDSSRARHLAVCGADGSFAVEQARPGEYIVRAFLDLRADSLCGDYPCAGDSARACPEPCVRLPGVLTVKPGVVVEVPRMVLRRREGP
jgi:Bacterial Ig-like domain